MKIKGILNEQRIWIDGIELLPDESQKVHNHSPDGFSYGYGGSGPAQLALAILLSVTDRETAQKRYQDFKWEIISKLPQDNFEIDIDIQRWLQGENQCG